MARGERGGGVVLRMLMKCLRGVSMENWNWNQKNQLAENEAMKTTILKMSTKKEMMIYQVPNTDAQME